MFDPGERGRIRDELVADAQADPDIVGAALVGSAARAAEDRWSDIDLVLQLAPGADEAVVVDRWTRSIGDRWGIADTLDVFAADEVRYRVFLLDSSLQVDVSFWPHDLFRATEKGFRVLFGTPGTPTHPAAPDARNLIGMAWLFALHARSAVARGRAWQAAMMLDDLRNQLIALSCVRAGLNPWHGRDADRLDAASLAPLEAARASSLGIDELRRSKDALLALFHDEVERHDAGLASRLAPALAAMSG